MFTRCSKESLRGEVWYRRRFLRRRGGREELEMAESLMAKRVVVAEEKKSSGESWRRVAMTVKPARLRVLEAPR
ncbi:hypothetical protein C1H46_038530 [Malus baccata]|nr:hypothetical protein C1H46_038530 [Malus baccata]